MFTEHAWLFNVHLKDGRLVPEDEVIEARHEQCVKCHPNDPFGISACDIASAAIPTGLAPISLRRRFSRRWDTDMAHLPFIDLHAHFPMHTPFPPAPFENPLDFWRKPAFDAMNAALNYENLQPRVTLPLWFDDSADFGVTGFGSVLYNPQEDFFVDATPIPKAFDHIVAQLTHVEAELRRDGRVKIAAMRIRSKSTC